MRKGRRRVSGKASLRRDLNKVRDGGKRISVGRLISTKGTAKTERSEPGGGRGVRMGWLRRGSEGETLHPPTV